MGISRPLQRKIIVCLAPKRDISAPIAWIRPPAAQPIQRAAAGKETNMWRKTVWLIAALTLGIFVALIAARDGWAQKSGTVYRVGVVLVLPPNLLPPNAPQP
jgi:hypothetical protein